MLSTREMRPVQRRMMISGPAVLVRLCLPGQPVSSTSIVCTGQSVSVRFLRPAGPCHLCRCSSPGLRSSASIRRCWRRSARRLRTTFNGSMMPALTMSTYSGCWRRSRCWLASGRLRRHDRAVDAAVVGDLPHRGLDRVQHDVDADLLVALGRAANLFDRVVAAQTRATPPPGRMPSSTAARVACKASSTRAFFCFISASVLAPTEMIATPPVSFARRSWNFSRSYSLSVFSI